MALARLCADIRFYDPAKRLYNFTFVPFVVDHNARQGSAEEADRVRRRLRGMGKRLSPISFYHN